MMDMMERGRLKLDKIEYVVLDEADEMLKMGFAEDIEKILSGVAKEDPRDNTHQTLLYSATMPSWVKQVSSKYLKPDHKHVDLVGNDANKTAAGPFPLAYSDKQPSSHIRIMSRYSASCSVVLLASEACHFRWNYLGKCSDTASHDTVKHEL